MTEPSQVLPRGAARLLLTGVLVLAVAAPAEAHRIAVGLPRTTAGKVLREGFRSSLAGGLVAAGQELVSTPEIDRVLATSPALAACDTDTCLVKLAQLTAADTVLRSNVEVLGSSNYSFRLEIFDARRSIVVASVEDTCSICTVRDANEALSGAAAKLGRKLTPDEVQAPQPPPAIAAVRAPAPRTTVSTPRSRLQLGFGVASLIFGAGAVGGGAALIAIDGRSHGDGVVGRTLQTDTLHTRVPGIVLTSAGALLLAGGGVLLWRAHENRRPAP